MKFLVLALSLVPAVPTPASGLPTPEAFSSVAVPLVKKWEGQHLCRDGSGLHCAYLDRIARPPVWTACHGETNGITGGMRFTTRQCEEMLARQLLRYRDGLHEYFTPETKQTRLTPQRDAAYTSLAYNAGIRGIGRSTATRRLNAGNIRGGCQALTWWNKAGGRVIRGLVNRRSEEYALCMEGL